MKLGITSAALLSALAGCSDSLGPSLVEGEDLVLQVIEGFDWKKLANDPATITAAHLEGRILHVRVQVGGGCKPHRFALVADGALAESNPPYAQFRLAHDGDGDPCDALLTRDLVVDLSPIIPLVQQSGGTALRFVLVEPGGQPSAVGELLLTL
jgi:hypothetical protein